MEQTRLLVWGLMVFRKWLQFPSCFLLKPGKKHAPRTKHFCSWNFPFSPLLAINLQFIKVDSFDSFPRSLLKNIMALFIHSRNIYWQPPCSLTCVFLNERGRGTLGGNSPPCKVEGAQRQFSKRALEGATLPSASTTKARRVDAPKLGLFSYLNTFYAYVEAEDVQRVAWYISIF